MSDWALQARIQYADGLWVVAPQVVLVWDKAQQWIEGQGASPTHGPITGSAIAVLPREAEHVQSEPCALRQTTIAL